MVYTFLQENEEVRSDISHGPVDKALQCKGEAGTFVGGDTHRGASERASERVVV